MKWKLAAGCLAIGTAQISSAAQANDFCSDLKKVVASAFESPNFQSVSRGTGSSTPGTILFGGLCSCSVTRLSTGSQYGCSLTVPASENDVKQVAEGLKSCVKACFNYPIAYEPGLAQQYAGYQTSFMLTQPAGTLEIAVFPKSTSAIENRSVHLIVLGPIPPR